MSKKRKKKEALTVKETIELIAVMLTAISSLITALAAVAALFKG